MFFVGFVMKYVPNLYRKLLNSALKTSDADILKRFPWLEDFFLILGREAYAQGSLGPFLDAKLCYSNWPIRLSEMKNRIVLWHGTKDKLAPYGFAKYLAQSIPHAAFRVFEGEGHFLFFNHREDLKQQLFGLSDTF